MRYGRYRIWFGGNQEFCHKILSFLIFVGFNTGTYLTWKRTEWTQEKKLRWSSFIASGGRERIQVWSKLSLQPLSWANSPSYDHLCETLFELWLKLCNESSHMRLRPLLGLPNWTFPLFLSSHKPPLRVYFLWMNTLMTLHTVLMV